MSEVKRGLGRGLSSLLGEVKREEPIAGAGASEGVRMLAVAAIFPNPDQPRRHFDESALDELAASVKARGLIQPIVVRPSGKGFEIVAGERRWRAAQRAQLHQIPALIRTLDDGEMLELAIIENIQREDLNAIEEAESYQRLAKTYGHSQEALAKLVGKSRSHVANLLRLLDLPPAVRAMVVDGRLSMGHARALIGAPDAEAIAHDVVKRGLSVRETEALVRKAKPKPPKPLGPLEFKSMNADIVALERQLGDLLGLKVAIQHRSGGDGTVALDYSTLDQLDMICQRLSGGPI
ncbi:ParB family chromosome partitioning protein [Sphingomonas vulcanisoli]|uniref:ParB family chromosome partitioning protein n=1 Tax=Sphingomonas vulcanisoli TaxID=1658060 RepID=A0ABX0TTC3_9SPHN|nr:ParB family chromosome partitioning protein [Sphingomonas vulcanisoli]